MGVGIIEAASRTGSLRAEQKQFTRFVGAGVTGLSLPETELWFRQHRRVDFDEIRNGPDSIPFSDAWLNMMMNFQIEFDALERFRKKYETEHQGSSYYDQEFNSLLKEWLRNEIKFGAAENGCEHHLKLQPRHFFRIAEDENGLFVAPTDLSQFGDQARRYVMANELVGEGLVRGYRQLFQMGSNAGIGIMSPQEHYEKSYNSKTDVVNLMIVTGQGESGLEAEGIYLVLGRVLPPNERRFLHNLFFTLGHTQYDLNQLAGMSRQELEALIPELVIMSESEFESQDVDVFVNRPNTFYNNQTSLFEMALAVNTIYSNRYGKELINDRDIDMYPIINNLVDKYLPDLLHFLWESPNKKEYYRWLRLLLIECQSHWNEQRMENIGIPVEFRLEYAISYLQDLALGRIQVGFEIGGSLLDSPFENSPFTSLYDLPFGYNEMNRYCRPHRCFYTESSCPKCEKKSNGSNKEGKTATISD